MAVKQVIIPSNLGTEFDIGVIEASKIRVKLNTASIVRNASNELEAIDASRVVTTSTILLATDRIIFVQNGAVAITLTIPTALKEVSISRSLNSTGAITIIYAGGTIEALAGTLGASTTLATIAAYGGGQKFRQNPNNSAQMLRVRT